MLQNSTTRKDETDVDTYHTHDAYTLNHIYITTDSKIWIVGYAIGNNRRVCGRASMPRRPTVYIPLPEVHCRSPNRRWNKAQRRVLLHNRPAPCRTQDYRAYGSSRPDRCNRWSNGPRPLPQRKTRNYPGNKRLYRTLQ